MIGWHSERNRAGYRSAPRADLVAIVAGLHQPARALLPDDPPDVAVDAAPRPNHDRTDRRADRIRPVVLPTLREIELRARVGRHLMPEPTATPCPRAPGRASFDRAHAYKESEGGKDCAHEYSHLIGNSGLTATLGAGFGTRATDRLIVPIAAV